MNTITKYVSLNMVTLSFFASITTQCMHIKKFKPINLKQLTLVPNNEHTIKRTYHFNPEKHEALSSAINLFFKSENNDHKSAALKIFSTFISSPALTKNLAQENKAYEVTIQAAKIGTLNDAPYVQREALNTFLVLVEKEYAFEPATNAAARGIQSEYFAVRIAAQSLFNALFKKNLAFETAALAATAAIKSNDPSTRNNALSLFCDLFHHKQGFEIATQTAKDAFLDESPHIKGLALELFKNMVTENHAFEEAMQTAVIGMDCDAKTSVHIQATELFDYLLRLVKQPEENNS